MCKPNSIPEQKRPAKKVDSQSDEMRIRLVILMQTELRATYQRYLVKLFSKNKKQVGIKQAANILRLSSCEAKDVLQHMTYLAWIKQEKSRTYTLTAKTPEEVVDWNQYDPWIIASKVFKPCYIGGWSAAQYWKLTNEYVKGGRVFTQQEIDAEKLGIKNHVYSVKSTEPELFFGLDTVMQQGVKVALSDPERTLIDFIANPDDFTFEGAGMDDAQKVFHFYMHSRYKDLERLSKYILQCHHSSILFKRFGFLMESFYPQEKGFIKFSQMGLSNQYVRLDNTPPNNEIAQKWRIYLPDNWEEGNANRTGKQIYEIFADP